MKIYLRILSFARPIEKYAIPYFFCTLFHALFNTFNFVMITPILNVLFDKQAMLERVTQRPELVRLNMDYFRDLINYFLYRIYGIDYSIQQVLIFLAMILVTSALFSNLFRYLGQRTVENMKIETLRKMRNKVFDNVMGLNIGYINNERKGDIISKISSDVQVVQYCISNTLQVVFREPFLIIGYMAALIYFSWELTLFTIVFLPVAALVIGAIVKKLKRKATKAQKTYADMVSTLDESLSGVKIIQAYNATDYIKNKFHEINRAYSRITRSMTRRQQLSSPASEFLGISALAVLLIYGGNLVLKGSLTGSVFIVYLAIFSQITRPIRSFADSFANIHQGIAAGERVLQLMDTKSTVTEKEDAIELTGFGDRLEFKNVRFSYGSKEVIKDINFTVCKGEAVALVGPSGGGKSTISDLIPRFYDVGSGEVTLDGINVKDYTLASLRDQIGVVSQDTVLFNDTIENNLRMGKRDATMEEIIEAAKIANAHDFIMQTEEGYQTNIGDRGVKLSGGQRQRLSIARAVLKNPPILILDEATSALDTESEKLVQDALESLLDGRTSIVIAHRLSTIYNSDKILVIEDGKLVEQGTHTELVEHGGVYYRLVELQHMN